MSVVSLELASVFFTTVPSGKSQSSCVLNSIHDKQICMPYVYICVCVYYMSYIIHLSKNASCFSKHFHTIWYLQYVDFEQYHKIFTLPKVVRNYNQKVIIMQHLVDDCLKYFMFEIIDLKDMLSIHFSLFFEVPFLNFILIRISGNNISNSVSCRNFLAKCLGIQLQQKSDISASKILTSSAR